MENDDYISAKLVDTSENIGSLERVTELERRSRMQTIEKENKREIYRLQKLWQNAGKMTRKSIVKMKSDSLFLKSLDLIL